MINNDIKKEKDYCEAPTPTQKSSKEELNEEYCTICPECSSAIEITLINEENNIIEFKCLKDNNKYVMTIKEYLEKVKNYEKKNIENLKDKCKKHSSCINNDYISFCFDCNIHLCNHCLKTRIHIKHRKSNIIEIQPVDEELNIIDEVIKDYKNKLENLRKEQINTIKSLKDLLKKNEIIEGNKLQKKIKNNKNKEEKELELNKNSFLNDIKIIKRKYEEEIKIRKNKFLENNNNINNKYKIIIEKEKIKYKLIIEKLNKKCDDDIKNYQFEKRINYTDNMLKLNEIINIIYHNYNNNYYNAVNINNLLLYYCESEYINEKIMKKILKKNYENMLKIIKQKNNDDMEFINQQEEKETKKENEKNEMKRKIKEISQNIF